MGRTERGTAARHAQGKIISIPGTIELHEGKPEINVVSADQIEGLDSPLIELLRAAPAVAQWSEAHFAEMSKEGQSHRVILVLEEEAQCAEAGETGRRR